MSQHDQKIDVATPQAWTSKESDYNVYNACNAFLIPAQDLQGSLAKMQGQTGQKYIRANVGVNMSTTPSTKKLINVGTKPESQKEGNIIYLDLIKGYTSAVNEGDNGSICKTEVKNLEGLVICAIQNKLVPSTVIK